MFVRRSMNDINQDSMTDFYRATLMHSADYAVARCLPVCLSVCPSVFHTPVFCLNGYTYPGSFTPLGSSTILVFPHQTRWQYSDGNSPNVSVECKGYEKSRFSTNISLYLVNGATKLSNGTSLTSNSYVKVTILFNIK